MNSVKVSILITLATVIASVATLVNLPEGLTLPIHWNINGEIDRFADATHALLMPPAIMIGTLTLLFVLKYIEPRKQNLLDSLQAAKAIITAIIVFFAVIEASYIALIMGVDFEMHKVILSAVGALFIVTGNYMTKTRSNFFIGIKTPWTLSSDSVWKKTHRLGGKLFMIAGLLIIVLIPFIDNQVLKVVLPVVVLPAALIPVAYSWWAWRQEQEQEQG